MANPFDQFDESAPPQASTGNPFDQFDATPEPQAAEPAAPSFMDQAKRQIGLAARIPFDAATAIPLMLSDALIAGSNLVTGRRDPLSSEVYNERIGQVFGKPESWQEKVGNIGASAVLGSKIPIPGIDDVQNVARTVAPARSAADDVIREGEKHGVPVFYDDVTNSAFAKKLGTAAESIPGPFGTGKGRAAQSVAAQKAAQKVVDDFRPAVGDDVPVLIQEGLKSKLKAFRGAADRLYTKVATTLDPLGDVPTVGMDREIAKASAAQQKLGTLASKNVGEVLEKYKNAPRGNFSQMRELRSQLKSDISDFYTGANATIGDRGVTALKAMQDALDADMAAFAKQSGGEGFKAWKAADGFYKANIVPFREAGFRDLVKTGEPEKAWRYLVANKSIDSRAARMYNSLDEPGRGAVRAGLVKEAMNNATNPNGSFSPAKFAKYIEDHEAAVNTFFKGRDADEIKGFTKLMRHVERAGQYAENPPTGNRLIPILMGGAAFVEPTTAGVVAGSGLTVSRLFQTKTGRDLLLAASRAKDPRALNEISARTAKFLAVASSRAAQDSGAAKSSEEPPQE